MARRIERVLTNEAGLAIARQVDAGYDEARDFARQSGIKVPIDKM
jgi:urocanate hydratase